MSPLPLPKTIEGKQLPQMPRRRQVTIIGANGAGKSLFMQEMMRLCEGRAYCLSSISSLSMPASDSPESRLPGSIDDLYNKSVLQQSYLRTDAVSEIDKLTFMLFTDEFEYLLDVKSEQLAQGHKIDLKPTKLDQLKRLWEKIFPGNHIVRHKGKLMFATTSGDDLISAAALSQGERTVLYYVAGVLYAMPGAVIFIDSPSLFVHPSITNNLWNAIEELRSDCTFVYNSVDMDFVGSRTENACIWVKSYDAQQKAWDYDVLDNSMMTEELFLQLAGSRKPVLFIEGDTTHSIDAKLYTLVFQDYTVRPLGSCNKVIETTRSFNDLKYMHHLDSRGIVDRDRRTDVEVNYLKRKNILVPDVAEVENIFLIESIIRTMAKRRGRDPEKVIGRVRKEVMKMFKQRAEEQTLLHVRHKMKRDVECKIDAKFTCITALETHIRTLVFQLKPREYYNMMRQQFAAMIRDDDYPGVLRVFNHKPMLADCMVAQLLGYKSKDEYIAGVIDTLKSNSRDAEIIRTSVKHCLGIDEPHNEEKEEFYPQEKFFSSSRHSRHHEKKDSHRRKKTPAVTCHASMTTIITNH